MKYELVFESSRNTGIVGVVKSESPIVDEVISAYSIDRMGKESLISSSILTHFRSDAPRRYNIANPYCGFNLPFPFSREQPFPTNVLLRINGEDVGHFENLTEAKNEYGVLASRVLDLSARSFYGVSGFDVTGGQYSIHGTLTPPRGMFEEISMVTEPGIDARLVWPIHAPDTADFYWYVPGSPGFGFRIDINMPDSTPHTRPYLEFQLRLAGESDNYNTLRNITVPLELSRFMNYPPDFNVQRVQRLSNRTGAAIAGFSDAHRISKLVERYRTLQDPFTIMDWGCGFGRVSRHFNMFAPKATVLGCDIDDTNLVWMAEHLPQVKPVKSDISGNIELETGTVDVIWGISVMTHLRMDVQRLWMKELARLLSTDGLLLLTVAGASSLAFASRWINNKNVDDWHENGQLIFDNAGGIDNDIGGTDYYIQSKQNEAVVREVWSEFVDVVEFVPSVFGYQDMVVCRAKP